MFLAACCAQCRITVNLSMMHSWGALACHSLCTCTATLAGLAEGASTAAQRWALAALGAAVDRVPGWLPVLSAHTTASVSGVHSRPGREVACYSARCPAGWAHRCLEAPALPAPGCSPAIKGCPEAGVWAGLRPAERAGLALRTEVQLTGPCLSGVSTTQAAAPAEQDVRTPALASQLCTPAPRVASGLLAT